MSREEIRITLRLPPKSGQEIARTALDVAARFNDEYPDRKPGIRNAVVYSNPGEAGFIAYRTVTGVVVYVENAKEFVPGIYKAPDGVVGTIHGFDAFANNYSFMPEGMVAPAIVGPGWPDPRRYLSREKFSAYVLVRSLTAGEPS